MLELILLSWLCKGLGRELREKGRNPLPYQVMLILMWFVGEVAGAVAAAGVYFVFLGHLPRNLTWWTYICAILGGACGAAVCFIIALGFPAADRTSDRGKAYNRGSAGTEFLSTDPNTPYSSPQAWND